MALLLTTGDYLAVESVDPSINPTNVVFRLYQDADARKRFKAGKMGKFETTIQDNRIVTVVFSKLSDPLKSINDNIITAAYEALKTLPDFSKASDV